MDGTCYLWDQRCDGVRQCVDGQDEMGCEYPREDPYTPVSDRRGLVTQHYVMVGSWIWAGHFIMWVLMHFCVIGTQMTFTSFSAGQTVGWT